MVKGFGYFAYHERPRKRQTVAACSPAQKALQAAVVEKVLRCAEFGVAGVASLGIRGKRVAWRGLTVPRLAAATVTQRSASRTQILRMEKVGRTLLRASSFRWYRFQTVVEIKATHPVRRCRCEACRHLECRSFKSQNDGPLRCACMFPALEFVQRFLLVIVDGRGIGGAGK